MKLPCHGSGEAIRHHHATHPEALRDVLAYFDAATASRHIDIPVLVAPPGQFAVYHALAGPSELFVRSSGHPTLREDDSELWTRLSAWFAA